MFLDYIYDDFAAMTAVNLDGFFHLTQRVVRHMAEQAADTSSTSPRASSITRGSPRRLPSRR